MKFLDLFSGIGGFRLGMEQAGHECVGFCEIDKFARKSYKAIHDTLGEYEFHDITAVTDEQWRALHGTVDVICGGFPCQSFSIAGNRRGFEETRGTLFFQIARAAKQIKPQFLFLENVKGLLNHDKGDTFRTILSTLDELGYYVEWQILNSKDYGVPQHRERVFIIGHLRGERFREIFPIGGTSVKATIQILAHRDGYRRNTQVFSKDGITEARAGGGRGHYVAIPVLTPEAHAKRPALLAKNKTSNHDSGVVIKVGNVNPSGKGMNGNVYDSDGVAPTLTTNKGEGPKILQRPRGFNSGGEHEIAPTLSSSSWQENNLLKVSGIYTNDSPEFIRIRKLTPRECWRLQGFPDWAFDKAREVNSDSQLYKQAGNSVTVPVIYAIAKLL
ncbi:cytosine-specific methyltransferase [Lactococcus hodotermopsidis]|uniref:Cytosine-specific methyltransferase n=1 Tax=Pseudolactococcus hodotermopsidis TaxID=2709157 RepID=A0A6A0BFA2_9LACT|nr:DNA (cytosine-5-)-methyltransferase [Lactococcus hodotermopsidis]GFH43018.1 cytosine-specific methyltransferase [Lactococcus hodotermopsidis]